MKFQVGPFTERELAPRTWKILFYVLQKACKETLRGVVSSSFPYFPFTIVQCSDFIIDNRSCDMYGPLDGRKAGHLALTRIRLLLVSSVLRLRLGTVNNVRREKVARKESKNQVDTNAK